MAHRPKLILTDADGLNPQAVENADAGKFKLVIGSQVYERVGTTEHGIPVYSPR